MKLCLPFRGLIPPRISRFWLTLCALLISVLTASAQTVYVTETGGSPKDGTSWATAYAGTALQGLLASSPASTTVLVASGLYKPTAITTDRFQSFTIAAGVQVYGGYDPVSNARTTDPSSTTLSGDIDNNNTLDAGNSYHVVWFNNANSQNRLDGFVITGGNADGDEPYNKGGGLLNSGGDANPTVAYCSFIQNKARDYGGAIFNQSASSDYNIVITHCAFTGNTVAENGGAIFNNRPENSSPSPNESPILISHCTFKENLATNLSGQGGAIFNNAGGGGIVSPTISDCSFTQNTSGFRGGAIYNGGTFGGFNSSTIIRCNFTGNISRIGGGAIYNNGESGNCHPQIISCSFSQNFLQGSSNGQGGAIYNYASNGNSNPIITNCSFTKNGAPDKGGAIVCIAFNSGKSFPVITNCSFNQNGSFDGGGALYLAGGNGGSPSATLTNSILFNNGNSPIDIFFGDIVATSSLFDVASSYTTDPSNLTTTTSPFIDADNENLQLVACSLPVNAGTNSATALSGITTDLAGNPRFVGTIDMGAYEVPGTITITGPPASASVVCAGSSISVPVSATSNNSITYQWYKADSPLAPPQTTATLSLTNVQASDGGRYQLVLTSGCESLTTTAFSLSVGSGPAPVLSITPSATQPILQNAPFVSLNVAGCEGGIVNWRGSNGTSGSGNVISVPTTTVTSLVYSATCTVGSCASEPGSSTVTISPSLVNGSFDGFVNGADCSTFRGWAWDRDKVNTAILIDILDGPKVIATLLADVFRQDLQTAGKGNGKHAFSFPIPSNLKDGFVHNLSARVGGSSFILKDSPKALICQGSSTPENKAPVPPSPTVLIAPLAAQVGVPFSGTLVSFTDPEAKPLIYILTGLPGGLSINMTSRVISGTPTQSGTFVLTYSATDEGGLTNSVSFPLTVNPASTTTVTGSFEGYLDKLDCVGIRGWVWDRNKPNTPLTVEFYLDGSGTVLGSTVANIYRQDLKDAGKGNGSHAYNFTPPGSVTNGTKIRARVLGSTYDLKGSPKEYQCANARLSAETGPELQVTVLGNPVTDQVKVEIRGAEGQALRMQLSDVQGRLIGLKTIEKAAASELHSLDVRFQPSGLLLLQVSMPNQARTLKVIKP